MRDTKGTVALCVASAVLLGIAACMAWTVTRHIHQGETRLPSKHPSLQRTILRNQEPVSFWAAISVYSVISLGCGSLGLWCCRETWRLCGWTIRPKS